MGFVTVVCVILSIAFVFYSTPNDIYFLNLAIYMLLLGILRQLVSIYETLKEK
jgi:hypothetical protein